MRATKRMTCILAFCLCAIIFVGCNSNVKRNGKWATFQEPRTDDYQFAYMGKTCGEDNLVSYVKIRKNSDGTYTLLKCFVLADANLKDVRLKGLYDTGNYRYHVKYENNSNVFYSDSSYPYGGNHISLRLSDIYKSKNSAKVVGTSFTSSDFVLLPPIDISKDLNIYFEYEHNGQNGTFSFTFPLYKMKF